MFVLNVCVANGSINFAFFESVPPNLVVPDFRRFIEWRAGSKTKKGTLGPSRKVAKSEESPTRTPSMVKAQNG